MYIFAALLAFVGIRGGLANKDDANPASKGVESQSGGESASGSGGEGSDKNSSASSTPTPGDKESEKLSTKRVTRSKGGQGEYKFSIIYTSPKFVGGINRQTHVLGTC